MAELCSTFEKAKALAVLLVPCHLQSSLSDCSRKIPRRPQERGRKCGPGGERSGLTCASPFHACFAVPAFQTQPEGQGMPVNTYQKRNRIPYQYAYVENILITMHTCGKRCSVRAAQLGPLTEHSLSSHVRGGSRARVLACLLAGALPSLAGPASCGWLTRGAGKGHETQTQHMLTCLHTSRRSGAALEVGRPRRPRRLLRPTPAGSGEASEGKGVPTPVGLRARRGSFCRPLQRGLRGWNPGEGRRGWRPLAEGYLRPLPRTPPPRDARPDLGLM